ncbi:MAG: hypothetical protein ACRC9R_06720 [Enterovibrio sp.]
MSNELNRYAIIDSHMKRELLLLQGLGCRWKKCTFCDYYNDVSQHPFLINKPIIDEMTGQFSVVDVINSGSIFEIDEKTLEYLKVKLIEKNVKTLWCESHWMYHRKLAQIRDYFDGIDVKFRIGIETFDPQTRAAWKKGIPPTVEAKDIAQYFDGACFLVGLQGQTQEMILKDIELAKAHFSYFNINVFVENTTAVKRDEQLIQWFVKEVYPTLLGYEHIEVLVENTDLGVG